MYTPHMVKSTTFSLKIEPFDVYTSRYEKWFEDHKAVYQSELEAIRFILPQFKRGLEIGVGTGRFSQSFGIQDGIDPARNALRLAWTRKIKAIQGISEALPYTDNSFDLVLIVTTICFVDPMASLKEAFRVLKPSGSIVIGFVDRNSALGRSYNERREANPFYANAKFYGVDEVVEFLSRNGFVNMTFAQTIYKRLEEIKEAEPVKQGYGEGSFVVVYARKPQFPSTIIL